MIWLFLVLSVEICHTRSIESCIDLPDVALEPCSGDSKVSWYLDKQDLSCKSTHFCIRNSNNFRSYNECSVCLFDRQQLEHKCWMPPLSVLENARFACEGTLPGKRAYFDKLQGKCRWHQRNTCQQTGNIFLDLRSCEDVCEQPGILAKITKNSCSSVPDDIVSFNDTCKQFTADVNLWYFRDGLCWPFRYTNCLKGSVNTFLSREDCEQFCHDCNASVDEGEVCATRRGFKAWHFDGRTCRPFQFRGCGGNANRFLTKKTCLDTCDHSMHCSVPLFDEFQLSEIETEQNICFVRQAIENLPELPSRIKYRFSQVESDCRQFNYSGFGVEVNVFDDRRSCQQSCGKLMASDMNFLISTDSRCLKEIPAQCKTHAFSKRYNETRKVFKLATTRQTCEAHRILDTPDCQPDTFLQDGDECLQLCSPRPKLTVLQNRCFVNDLETDKCPESKVLRWRFSPQLKECQSFRVCDYGDCGSSVFGRAYGNSFDSAKACEAICRPKSVKDVCSQPRDGGPCKRSLLEPRYFYNITSGRCESFDYGGCWGNSNRFHSERECQEFCGSVSQAVKLPPVDANRVSVPEAELKRTLEASYGKSLLKQISDLKYGFKHWVYAGVETCGLGEAEEVGQVALPRPLTRYRFDPGRESCEAFTLTTWPAGINVFDKREDCQSPCVRGQDSRVFLPNVCLLETSYNTNVCEERAQWRFSWERRRCERTLACDGYGNKFATREACSQICIPDSMQDICQLPGDPGVGDRLAVRWFYDWTRHKCAPFLYGGALGNANRFLNVDECEKTCRWTDPCLLSNTQQGEVEFDVGSLNCVFRIDEGSNSAAFASMAECVRTCTTGSPNLSPSVELPVWSGTASATSTAASGDREGQGSLPTSPGRCNDARELLARATEADLKQCGWSDVIEDTFFIVIGGRCDAQLVQLCLLGANQFTQALLDDDNSGVYYEHAKCMQTCSP